MPNDAEFDNDNISVCIIYDAAIACESSQQKCIPTRELFTYVTVYLEYTASEKCNETILIIKTG